LLLKDLRTPVTEALETPRLPVKLLIAGKEMFCMVNLPKIIL
jgi:hypothetical protein